MALKLTKNLFYFHDAISILIVAYSLDYTIFNFWLILFEQCLYKKCFILVIMML